MVRSSVSISSNLTKTERFLLMIREISTYLLYIVSVAIILIAFKRYDLQLALSSYVNEANDDNLEEDDSGSNFAYTLNLIVAIAVAATPIKYKYYQDGYWLYAYLVIQSLILLVIYLRTKSFQNLVFATYFVECLERKEKGYTSNIPPWYEVDLTIFNYVNLLDIQYLDFVAEMSMKYQKTGSLTGKK